MGRALGDIITFDFTTHDPETGQVSDADFIPTCEVFEDDSDVPILSLTATKRTDRDGNYRITFTASTANGFERGKSYNIIALATVGGISAKARIGAFKIDTIEPTLEEIKEPAGDGYDREKHSLKALSDKIDQIGKRGAAFRI